MKQEEKNQQSKEKILRAAMEEFGKNGYAGASLNTLLSDNGLSKGLIYHYFQSKDQLYLGCVSVCMDMLMNSLVQMERSENAMAVLRTYFETRGRFFHEYPLLERIFFDAVLQPPSHLEQEIAQIRTNFDTFNRTLFQSVLSGVRLRQGVSKEDGLYYFNLIQQALHIQFRSKEGLYEEWAYKTMEFILYGLAGGELS